MQETTQNSYLQNICKIHKFLSYLLVNFDLLNLLHYRMIKLICNRVIHESEIVCRYLNSTLQFTQRERQVKT
jgi:hypothetical protein